MTRNGLSEEDTAAVQRVVVDANAAIGANDIEAVLKFFAADARMLPPQGPPIEGRDALRAFFEGWPVYKSAAASDVRIDGRAGLAVATCTVAITHEVSDGGERGVSAKQLIALHKQDDGSWLISAILFNVEPAPTG